MRPPPPARRRPLAAAIAALLFAAAAGAARAAPDAPEPTSETAVPTTPGPEVRDYPDITYWTAWADERREEFAKARAKIREQLEKAKSLGEPPGEIERLRETDDELEKCAAELEQVLRYEIEVEDLEKSRRSLAGAERALAQRERAFEQEKLAPPPFTKNDERRAADDLAAISKTRDAMRLKVRELPRQLDETRLAREKALDDYLKLDPSAVDPMTRAGAMRERLKLQLAYYDSYLEFLPERLAVAKKRLDLLTRDEKLHEARLGLIRSVISGRFQKRADLARERGELERRLAAARKAIATAMGGTADRARLMAEEGAIEHRLWLNEVARRALDGHEQLDDAIPLIRRKIEKFQGEALNSSDVDPETLAADAARTRGFVETRRKAVDEQAARVDALAADFADHLGRLRESIAAAEREGFADVAADLRGTLAAAEAIREDATAVEGDLLRAQQDLAVETGKILKIRERALAKAAEKASLFDRRRVKLSREDFSDALDMARADLLAVRAEVLGGELRPRWYAAAVAAAAALALAIYLFGRRRIDAALRRIAS
jgi:hypothetical protein